MTCLQVTRLLRLQQISARYMILALEYSQVLKIYVMTSFQRLPVTCIESIDIGLKLFCSEKIATGTF